MPNIESGFYITRGNSRVSIGKSSTVVSAQEAMELVDQAYDVYVWVPLFRGHTRISKSVAKIMLRDMSDDTAVRTTLLGSLYLDPVEGY